MTTAPTAAVTVDGFLHAVCSGAGVDLFAPEVVLDGAGSSSFSGWMELLESLQSGFDPPTPAATAE